VASHGNSSRREGGERMLDIVVVVVSLVAFLALIGLTVGCERL
jgi:hypothetical protein